jgi:hypothetical protein
MFSQCFTPARAPGIARRRTVTPPAQYAPTAGMDVWLKADSISSTDGTAVSSWGDQSGNGRNAAQVTGSLQPLYKTAIVNNHPVVRFDGVDDFLQIASWAQALNQTFFVVFAFRTATEGSAFARAIEIGDNSGFAICKDGGGAGVYAQLFDGNQNVLVTPAVANQFMLVTMTRTTGGTIGNSYLNGNFSATRTSSTTTTARVMTLGRYTGSNLPSHADIAEVLLYQSLLTTAQITTTNRYLGAKYGLTVA